jgi:hypothetical protein
VESILENPEAVLRKQLDRVKTEKLAELKAQGMEYDERMAELENLEYPKPNREFIYETFNKFAKTHPWVGQENIRPKSVAREMFETFSSFPEYIRDYGLQRVEGQLLRYLSDVYKAVVQTVPEPSKDASATDEVRAIEEFLGSMIRGIDSSLLDEWERMRNPAWVPAAEAEAMAGAECVPEDITRNRKALAVLIRNDVFRLVRALASRDFETALSLIEAEGVGEDGQGVKWSADELERRLEEFRLEHSKLCTDPKARAPQYLRVQQSPGVLWKVEQTLTDPEGHNDWVAELSLDLERSRQAGKLALRMERIGPVR